MAKFEKARAELQSEQPEDVDVPSVQFTVDLGHAPNPLAMLDAVGCPAHVHLHGSIPITETDRLQNVRDKYGMRWRIETFFEDSKQDLGLGDCEMQPDEGASRHWHLLMAAYSLVRLDPDLSTFGDGSLESVIASSEPRTLPERSCLQSLVVGPG